MDTGKTFDDLMKELDELDPSELNDDTIFDYTGVTLNLHNWERYKKVTALLNQLLDTDHPLEKGKVTEVRSYSKPYPHEKYASVTVVTSALTPFGSKSTKIIADAMALTDRFYLSTHEYTANLSFIIDNIWLEDY